MEGNKMSDRPTPETDAEIYPMNGVDIVWPEFSRQLERERDEARNAIAGWENKWKCAIDMAARAELERDDALNKIKELNDILR